MRKLILVCVGGALGSVARYLVGLWAAAAFGPDFPVGTLTVNVVGSLLISVIFEASLRSTAVPPDLRLFLTTGIMGGLTTYSSFNYETLRLLDNGAAGTALLNMAATVLGCLAAGSLGLFLVRLLLRTGASG